MPEQEQREVDDRHHLQHARTPRGEGVDLPPSPPACAPMAQAMLVEGVACPGTRTLSAGNAPEGCQRTNVSGQADTMGSAMDTLHRVSGLSVPVASSAVGYSRTETAAVPLPTHRT